MNLSFSPDYPVFFDLETDGLYGPIRLAQFYQPQTGPEPLVIHRPDPLQLMAATRLYYLVGHNLHYDFSTIAQNLGSPYPLPRWDDTFLASRLRYFRLESHSLDSVLDRCLGYDPYKAAGLVKKDLQKTKWKMSAELTPAQLEYAVLDVKHMPALYEAVSSYFTDPVYLFDKQTTEHCLQFQHNGMPIDVDQIDSLIAANMAEVASLAVPVNVNSYQQVRKYLGSTASDDLALAKMAADGDKKAKAVRETRKLIKQNSFLNKFLDSSVEERIYGKFTPSARSGRLTSKDQNLQQIPRALKRAFAAEPGKVLIYSDYAQLELRCACTIARETKMEKLLRQGADLHDYTARMLFGPDFTPTQRQIAKTCNFNLLYGGGAAMLGAILLAKAGVSMPDALLNKIRNKWLNLWTNINAWQQQGISNWRNGQPEYTPLGRKYVAARMTDQLNIQVQGMGAEVARLALHYILEELPEEALLVNFIHDSYIIEAPDDEELYRTIANLLSQAMQQAWSEVSAHTPIKDLPMPVRVNVGYNWGTIEHDYIKEFRYD